MYTRTPAPPWRRSAARRGEDAERCAAAVPQEHNNNIDNNISNEVVSILMVAIVCAAGCAQAIRSTHPVVCVNRLRM